MLRSLANLAVNKSCLKVCMDTYPLASLRADRIQDYFVRSRISALRLPLADLINRGSSASE